MTDDDTTTKADDTADDAGVTVEDESAKGYSIDRRTVIQPATDDAPGGDDDAQGDEDGPADKGGEG